MFVFVDSQRYIYGDSLLSANDRVTAVMIRIEVVENANMLAPEVRKPSIYLCLRRVTVKLRVTVFAIQGDGIHTHKTHVFAADTQIG